MMAKKTGQKRKTISPSGNDLTASQFQPGNPGGPGRPKGMKNFKTVVREALDAALREELADRLQAVTGRSVSTYAEAIVAAQVAAALKGDTRAFTALVDRLEGKPVQPIQTDDRPDVIRMVWDDSGLEQ